VIADRKRVLVYGNCQAGWMARTLAAEPVIKEQFEIVYLASFGVIPPDHPALQPGFMGGCSVIVWQTAAGFKPPEFLQNATADCRQIRFPTLWLKLLWPLNAGDPRNQAEPGFPYGRYPYGDRLVMKLMEEGVSAVDLPRRYIDTDINKIVNLERFTEMSLAELRMNDAQTDVAITPFIERTFRHQRLFATINHPTFPILARVFYAIKAALLGQATPESPPASENDPDIFGEIEIPLHPQVIRHFGLEWARPGMRWRYNSAFLTLEEFIRAYAEFTPIPMGCPPQLWLARGEQAAAHGDLAEAQRILIDATLHFPQLTEIWRFLGRIMADRGLLVEAERILRYATSRHPTAVLMICDLAMVMLRRQFPDEANRLANEALKVDGQCKEARQILHLAAQQTRLSHARTQARVGR
jgi:tetratricopeptide (TPR) repeat protein